MIHRRKGRKLKRTASHRKALLSNLSVSLIKNKKIKTTLAKAKELRTFIEPMINKSKLAYLNNNEPEFGVHARRQINQYLNDRGAVKTLFEEIAPKVAERNGGYTRVLKMGRRLGDSAEMALIELVDYNIEQTKKEETSAAETEPKKESKPKQKKTKKASAQGPEKTSTRSRKKKKQLSS
ncbi:MAG: 50S ribosomal protein L17 [Chlorobi bacterium]|nr:50S ribosomal protein L17 [Chlorobiota bacterium]MCI0714890.1 50S ribosomal protein L17 [Chlorobiota bacterium]